jgi:hypothetical protein
MHKRHVVAGHVGGYLTAAIAAAMLLAAGTVSHGPSLRAPDLAMLPDVGFKKPPRRHRRRSSAAWNGPGERERARRRRHIKAGQLTAFNGLVL